MTALSEIEKDLSQNFPPHSYEEWRGAAEALLKGKPFDKVLVTPTYEGFDLQPVFQNESIEHLKAHRDRPGTGSYIRGRQASGLYANRWKISQEHTAHDAGTVNKLLKQDLAGGVDEIHLVLDAASQRGLDPMQAEDCQTGYCGLPLNGIEDLEKVFEGIEINPETSLFIQSGLAGSAVWNFLRSFCVRRAFALEHLHGNLGVDPIGVWLRSGHLPCHLDKVYDATASLVSELSEFAPNMGAIHVDATVFHNAGSSAVQELGFALASANATLGSLTKRGIGADVVARSLRISFGVGSHYFLEIAKLRAARMLLARMLEAWGVSFETLPVSLHARTSLWNKTKVDPYVNMLRVTSEAFAAVIGGCDSLHVGPFDEILRTPDTFSRRIARNLHFILAEECELTRVIDPAGGSYYVEWLTDQVAQHAWKWFQQVETEGGMMEALRKGSVQKAVNEVAQKRLRNVEQRREIIVGTNQYPNATEKALDTQPVDRAALRHQRMGAVASMGSETLGKLCAHLHEPSEAQRIEALPQMRASEAYEKLREASRDFAMQKGHAPRILQANWGPSRSYRMRADWTSAFFQVAGIEMLNEVDFESQEDLLQSLNESRAEVVVITSTDDAYAEQVVPITTAIKAVNPATLVLVAGAPGDNESVWRQAGVDDFVHVRVNNFQMLRSLLDRMGALNSSS